MATKRYTYNLADIFVGDVRIGGAQSCSLEHSANLVPLKARERFPLDQAVGEESLKVKLGFARFDAKMVAQVLDATLSTGGHAIATEKMTATSTTYTAVNGAKFEEHVSVRDTVSGAFLDKVTSAPAANQYSVTAAGAYTFGTTGIYEVSYQYGVTAGQTIKVTNKAAGAPTPVKVRFYNEGSKQGHLVYACVFTGLNLSDKLKDWSEYSLEGAAQDDGQGNVWDIWTQE